MGWIGPNDYKRPTRNRINRIKLKAHIIFLQKSLPKSKRGLAKKKPLTIFVILHRKPSIKKPRAEALKPLINPKTNLAKNL